MRSSIVFALAGAVMLLLLPVPSFAAADVVGSYTVEGGRADGKDVYSGKAEITKEGDIYTVTWKLGAAGDYVGTGILTGDVLSVAFTNPGRNFFGLVVYKISGKKLEGKYAQHGGKRVTTEVLTRS